MKPIYGSTSGDTARTVPPYRLRTVLEDSEAIEKMVGELLEAIKNMEVPEEY